MAMASGRTRQRFSKEVRRRLVEAFRRSGLSQGRFARDRGIPASSLSRWKRELPELDPTPEAALLPVRLIDAGGGRGGPCVFEVRLSGGVEVAVPRGFDRASLAELVGLLGGSRC